MDKKIIPLLLALSGTALAAAPAAHSASAPAPTLALESKVYREAIVPEINGATRRAVTSASSARKGDRLLFMIRYRNDGTSTLSGADIVSPVSHRVMIDPTSSTTLEVSVDGGRRWDRPGATFLTMSDGSLRPAAGQPVTHVRFRINRPLAPGASGQQMFRATLL